MIPLAKAASEGIRPRRIIPVADWARGKIKFDSAVDAAPRYVPDKTPYHKPLFDWWLDDEVEQIFAIFPTQSGKTTAKAVLIAYTIENDPGPTIFAMADETSTKAFIRDRLKRTIKATFPGLVSDDMRNPDWSESRGIWLDKLHLWPAWGSSESRLRSWPRRYVYGDETSLWINSRLLAWERTKQFPLNRKAFWGTTPTLPGEQSWVAATEIFRHYRWAVPCPKCNQDIILEFSQLDYEHCKEGDTYNLDRVEKETRYICQICNEPIPMSEQTSMIRNGHAECITPDRPKRECSLRITSLDVPDISWGDSARRKLEALRNPDDYRVFVNSWMVEPWIDKREGLQEEIILARESDYQAGEVPKDAIGFGCGVDVQWGHLYVVCFAFLIDGRAVLVHYEHIDARPHGSKGEESLAYTRAALDIFYNTVMDRQFEWLGNKVTLMPRFAAIDCGDGSARQIVFDFANSHRGRIFPIAGDKSSRKGKAPVWSTPAEGLWCPQWWVSTDTFRDYMVGHWQVDLKEPGAWMLTKGIPQEFIKHICSWQLVDVIHKDKNGVEKSRRREWRQIRKDDHALDASIYCAGLYQALPNLGLLRTGGEPTPSPSRHPALAPLRTLSSGRFGIRRQY